MKKYLEGKIAVVTGSGQGIGRAIAIALAEQGAYVVTNNRKPGRNIDSQLDEMKLAMLTQEQRQWVKAEFDRYGGDAETTAAAIRSKGGNAIACYADISNYEDAGRLIDVAVDAFGRVDILVNVAGAFGFSPFEKMRPEMFEKVTSVKPLGYFNTCRHAVPHMLKNGWGRILNCSSRAWLGDIIRHAEYCTANAGVVGLTRALAVEYHDKGITANAFCPFASTRASVDLEMFDKAVKNDEKAFLIESKVSRVDDTPLPEDLAPFICYLCTDEAENISGSVFSVKGNYVGVYSDPVITREIKKEGCRWTVEDFMGSAGDQLFEEYHSIVERFSF